MKLMTICVLTLFAVVAHAKEKRVYQRDLTGNIMYHKPSYAVQGDGRIVEMDTIGNKQYHKQYQMKEGKGLPARLHRQHPVQQAALHSS